MSFITSLSIQNFFSIKDKVTIDFKASPYNIENNPERLFEYNGKYYNKIISFYGANASGKTTVLKAIVALADIVRNQNDKEFPVSFKNKFNNSNTTSQLAITFVLNIDNKQQELLYEVEFESNGFENIGIKNEQLQIKAATEDILINKKAKIVKNIDQNIIEAIFNHPENKKSLIQEFYKFESKDFLIKIIDFFISLTYHNHIGLYQSYFNVDRIDKKNIGKFLKLDAFSDELEIFYISFFNSIGLDFYKIEAIYEKDNGEVEEFKGINITHEIDKKEILDFDLESDGTQMLMRVLLDIYLAKVTKVPMIIDELDSSIHPSIVPIIINLLIENDIQIIYSTHNIYNMQFLQNDEIFLIEKDENHVTTIKPVKDNPDIKGYKNLLTLYENGYLGGIPNVKDIITKIL